MSWEQQVKFFELLPNGVMQDLTLFDVNTGLRKTPLLHLCWERETFSDVPSETIFEILPTYSAPELAKLRLAVEKITQRPQMQLVAGPVAKRQTISNSAACSRFKLL